MRSIVWLSIAFFASCNAATNPQAAGLELRTSHTQLERPEMVKLQVNASTGITRVEFYRDNERIGEDTSAPFTLELPFSKTQTVTHQLTAKGFDAQNAVKTSNAVRLEVKITGKIWYVSEAGSDRNDGSSEEQAFKTIQKGADQLEPGDTVLVMNGTYSNADPNSNVVRLARPGTDKAWVALMAYPGHSPKLRVRNWAGIGVNASYVLVQGFNLEGNRDEVTLEYALSERNNLNNPITSGNCIGVVSEFDQQLPAHHVIIRGNTVSKCPGGGIYTYSADYVTVEDNVISGNAFYAPYANSGLSFYQNWNSDSSTATKIIARRNIIFDNRNFVPFYFSNTDPAKRVITDGNGIIVDDTRNTQNNSTLGVYTGRTLIENNIVFENGARGIHVYSSDHVDIRHNTTYQNSIQSETPEGELSAIESSDVQVFNNIAVARSDRPSVTRYGSATEKASQVFERNLIFGGNKFDADASKNLVGVDPRFVDIDAKNFRVQQNSPAIDTGDSSRSSTEDVVQVARPLGVGVDLGAFEIR
jgi:parallel beta-helix repeat protein